MRLGRRTVSCYHDSHINWRVVEGYGAAIAAYGADLPVRLDCAVALIDHRRRAPRGRNPQGR